MSDSVFDDVFTSFDFPIVAKRTALMIIDMQYLDAHPDYGHGCGGQADRSNRAI